MISRTYTPPDYSYGANFSSFSFYVNDNSGASDSNSASTTVTLSVTQGDFPPATYDVSATVPNNGAVTVHLNASDPQGYPVVITITSFPTSGTLYRSDNTTITPSNPTVGSDNVVIYAPEQGVYGQNFTFSYQAQSSVSNLVSGTSSATVNVYRTYGAPIYTGQTAYSIPENSVANLLFSGSSQTGSYTIDITAITIASGSLVYSDADGNQAAITVAPFLMNSTENRGKFTPPANTSGVDMVIITLIVSDEYGHSDPVNITVTVYHINIAPKIVPLTYVAGDVTANWTSSVQVPENNCGLITWNVTDPDTPLSNLTSSIVSLPFRGKLYQYNADGSQGAAIVANNVIFPGTDNLFHAIYCPASNQFGRNYAIFSIIASDTIDVSSRQAVSVSVVHTDLPPYLNVTQKDWNVSVNSQVLVSGVSVGDPDAGAYTVKVVISLFFNDTSSNPDGVLVPQAVSHLTVINYNNQSCTTSDTNVCFFYLLIGTIINYFTDYLSHHTPETKLDHLTNRVLQHHSSRRLRPRVPH